MMMFTNILSFDINDFHDIGLVGGVFLVTVDAHNLLAGLHHVVLLGNLDDGRDHVVGSLIAFNLVAPNTAGNLQLSDNSGMGGAGKDWHWGLVF